jgi:hypothetical protein
MVQHFRRVVIFCQFFVFLVLFASFFLLHLFPFLICEGHTWFRRHRILATLWRHINLMLEPFTSQSYFECQLLLLSLHVKALWQELLLIVHYNWPLTLHCHVKGSYCCSCPYTVVCYYLLCNITHSSHSLLTENRAIVRYCSCMSLLLVNENNLCQVSAHSLYKICSILRWF